MISSEQRNDTKPWLEILPDKHTILLLDQEKKEKTYKFDGIFNSLTRTEPEFLVESLLPLLNTVLYEHKDASLLVFGPKKSGTTHKVHK